MDLIDKTFENFKEEAELFFVNKLQVGDKLEEQYRFCLDVIFNITKTKDFSRGLVASSRKYGQGKSFFFDVVHHRVKRIKNQNIYKRTTANELCDIYTNTKKGQDPIKELFKFISVKSLYIDDIGDELKDGKERSNYGNKINVLRYVILERYRLWQEKGYKLYGTTNLSKEQISSNYGGRVSDRFEQMVYTCDFTFLDGSFRQVASVRKLTQEEIRKNWLSLQVKKEQEKVNLEEYFDSMIQEDEKKLMNQGQYFWNFCCDFLKDKGLINDEHFSVIDERMKESARSLMYQDIRGTLRITLSNAPPGVYTSKYEEAKRKIGTKEVMMKCESIVARNRFLELKKQNHKFQ